MEEINRSQVESLDFSGLFKLDVLLHLDIATYSFYELGLKKFLAFSSDKDLIFIYIDQHSDRQEKNYTWDFVDNPIYCMYFEPSGTWLVIISDQKVLLVPFLPLFNPQNVFDHKWSLTCVSVLPLCCEAAKPNSLVWWLTKESENVLIIGCKGGIILFYSLESQSVVGESHVAGEITELQICFDDSLDLLALLISGGNTKQWKLVLEHRSFGYNWLQQIRAQNDKDKKDSFMNFIQLSKDKITLLIQGGSKNDNKSQTVEYLLKPTDYLPHFRKDSNSWNLTAQYVNGRHFLTAFELNEGTLILESPEDCTPSRILSPRIKKDGLYKQGLWSQRLIYLLRKNEIEVHSTNFSIVKREGTPGSKKDSTVLWAVEVIGDIRKAHLMSAKEPQQMGSGWKEPTFICDLQLPRFALEPCLVITSCGAYILNTVNEPSEWLVGLIVNGGGGAEQSAAALCAPLPLLLRCSADLLLARGKHAPAAYLYSLSKSSPDGWVARLGVFGKLQELFTYKQINNIGHGNAATNIRLLAQLLKVVNNRNEKFDFDIKLLILLTTVELYEMAYISASIGLWDLLPMFTLHRGHPKLLLQAINNRKDICRGSISCLLQHECIVPYLLEANVQNLFEYFNNNCNKFDTNILKRVCLWLNPLQDQLRPVMRDLRQDIKNNYTTKILPLISTFMTLACEIESREPTTLINPTLPDSTETWKCQFVPRRVLSCGHAHWAVADEGNLKVMMVDTPVHTELIGRVVSVACGRFHTLILTENGVYAAGDNTYGQLGLGRSWAGGTGDAGSASGAPGRVAHDWGAPVARVAAGHYHSAAVDVGGRLYTWGWGVHGQLGLGSIDDHFTPQLVTKFQGRKVLQVGCGICHTVVLMRNGEVWACGAGVFGQLARGSRDKSSLPVRVLLPEPIQDIAVGYFMNLALSSKGSVYTWGASPQQIRAAHARRAHADSTPASPTSPTPAASAASAAYAAPAPDPHLLPSLLDISAVQGRIIQMSVGWHHACLLNNAGTIYAWGLNFDGQLGTGNRKQLHTPTEVTISVNSQPDSAKHRGSTSIEESRAMVSCGGDFTVYVDHYGRIYATGSMHTENILEREKENRIIMMQTTRRVIKIPASRNNNKFLYQPVDRIDIMFPFDIDDQERKPLQNTHNPLRTIQDFNSKSWANDIILLLKPWIKDVNIRNVNMAAKLAYHNQLYQECLRLSLENLKKSPITDSKFYAHTRIDTDSDVKNENSDKISVINEVVMKRIKDISLSILNELPYPVMDVNTYKGLNCCCDELAYLKENVLPVINKTELNNMSAQAALVIDKCISMFPIDSSLWEACFRLAKDFYLDNNLSISELETVLQKYMKSNATTMAAAIMYSNDCNQYGELLSPKFYLNMCNQVLDTWG